MDRPPKIEWTIDAAGIPDALQLIVGGLATCLIVWGIDNLRERQLSPVTPPTNQESQS